MKKTSANTLRRACLLCLGVVVRVETKVYKTWSRGSRELDHLPNVLAWWNPSLFSAFLRGLWKRRVWLIFPSKIRLIAYAYFPRANTSGTPFHFQKCLGLDDVTVIPSYLWGTPTKPPVAAGNLISIRRLTTITNNKVEWLSQYAVLKARWMWSLCSNILLYCLFLVRMWDNKIPLSGDEARRWHMHCNNSFSLLLTLWRPQKEDPLLSDCSCRGSVWGGGGVTETTEVKPHE